jgi:hypothetical protein
MQSFSAVEKTVMESMTDRNDPFGSFIGSTYPAKVLPDTPAPVPARESGATYENFTYKAIKSA